MPLRHLDLPSTFAVCSILGAFFHKRKPQEGEEGSWWFSTLGNIIYRFLLASVGCAYAVVWAFSNYSLLQIEASLPVIGCVQGVFLLFPFVGIFLIPWVWKKVVLPVFRFLCGSRGRLFCRFGLALFLVITSVIAIKSGGRATFAPIAIILLMPQFQKLCERGIEGDTLTAFRIFYWLVISILSLMALLFFVSVVVNTFG
jgi:hypothetical protein